MEHVKCLIIGSGPAGLSAAVYAVRSNLNIMVAEKDFLGTGADLVASMTL